MNAARDSRPAVEFRHVFKSFGQKPVLKDVSFRVNRGEAFCVLGRSGVGKSVTLKLMDGLLKPDQGSVFIQGIDIVHAASAVLNETRKDMGFLFQSAALFDSLPLFENIAFPLRRHTGKSEREIREIVHEKLKEVELEKEGNTMPAQLSGGMRKRAGLARALSLDPRILLVDEPSTGLDRITAFEIYGLLLRLKKQRKVTLVVVTHDVLGVRGFTDRFAVLDKGIIVASGSYADLAESGNSLVRELVEGSEI